MTAFVLWLWLFTDSGKVERVLIHLLKNYNMTLQETRMKVWADAWCSTANAITCSKPEAATKWADQALKDFDERFIVKGIKIEGKETIAAVPLPNA